MEQEYRGRTLTFYELLEEYEVEIPIIQRDYAQGRKNKKELRSNFLNAIRNCLEKNQDIKLDFIYGSVVDGNFQPLDGQQRLTTLFLMHWYAAYKENRLNDTIKKLLSKFSYETRITSREFCHSLVNEKLIDNGSSQPIKEMIVNSNWFFLSWLNDPTIDSMLRTLKDIEAIFLEIEDIWDKLTNSKSLISFYFVELENIGLTDDLYIKMNARGKQLTPFETFKAGFQKLIQDNGWDYNKELKNSFGVKIDNDWTDFFWGIFRKNKSIDQALLRFISAINMIHHCFDRTILKADDRSQHINNLQEDPTKVRPIHFDKNSYDYLYKSFESYMDHVVLLDYVNRTEKLPLWRHQPNNTILSEVVFNNNSFSTIQKDSATYTLKVLFYAQNQFFHASNNFDEKKYTEWIRVVRNIISRADVDRDGKRPDIVRSPQSFDGAINLIHELSSGCLDIYEYLAELEETKSQFAKSQISEEIAKAKLIKHNPQYKDLIFSAEDNELLRGRISFIFYVIDYNYKCDSFNAILFKEIVGIFNKYFENENCLNNDLRRAFLTIEVGGNFEFYGYWWSFWHLGNATKRKLFDKFRELEYYIESDYCEYFKKLIFLLKEKPLSKIAEEFNPPKNFPNWKLKLIKDKNVLDQQSKTNFIAISEDESFCYLLKSKRPRELDGNLKIE